MNLKKLMATVLTVTTVFSTSITGLAVDEKDVSPTAEITKMERPPLQTRATRWKLTEREWNDISGCANATGTLCAMNGVNWEPTDIDWFYFYPLEGLWYIDLINLSADLDLEVYDENLKLVAQSRKGGTNSELIDLYIDKEPALNSSYYIKVYYYSGKLCTPYILNTTYASGVWVN